MNAMNTPFNVMHGRNSNRHKSMTSSKMPFICFVITERYVSHPSVYSVLFVLLPFDLTECELKSEMCEFLS